MTVPAVQEPPPRNSNRIKLRTSNFRPPSSSVYPQHSPSLDHSSSATVANRYSCRYGGADDISPPSSPDPDADGANRFLPGDVSPIDEDDSPIASRYVAQPGSAFPTDDGKYAAWGQPVAPEPPPPQAAQSPAQTRGATSIPMMRRERRKQSVTATRDAISADHGIPSQQQQTGIPSSSSSSSSSFNEAPPWDPSAAEPTGSSHGWPSQAAPAQFTGGLGISSHAWSSPQSSPAAASPSFGDRVRRIAKKAAAAREGTTDPAAGAFRSSRPSWRGASGRTAIVEPVYDTPHVPPLKIPEKSSKRKAGKPLSSAAPAALGPSSDGFIRRGQTPPMSPPLPVSETPSARSGPREALRRILPLSQPSPATAQPQQLQGTQSYPSPPPSGTPLAGDAPALAARELARDGSANNIINNNGPLPSPPFNANPSESPSAILRKPPAVHTAGHQHQVPAPSTYAYSQQWEKHPQASQLPAPSEEEPWVQPPSRFSITTYATSNTGTTRDEPDDPAGEEQPPVPSLPTDHQRGANTHPAKATNPADEAMKSSPYAELPSTTATAAATATATTTATTTTAAAAAPATATANPAIARAQAAERPASDVNKTLPPAPPEQTAGEARDRVGLLDARLRALANRRINIHRSIEQMTGLMPAGRLLDTPELVRRREAELRKVEALRAELADVQREEYELGLKLHRAYKRLDREAEWEPTTLWVRRVTA